MVRFGLLCVKIVYRFFFLLHAICMWIGFAVGRKRDSSRSAAALAIFFPCAWQRKMWQTARDARHFDSSKLLRFDCRSNWNSYYCSHSILYHCLLLNRQFQLNLMIRWHFWKWRFVRKFRHYVCNKETNWAWPARKWLDFFDNLVSVWEIGLNQLFSALWRNQSSTFVNETRTLQSSFFSCSRSAKEMNGRD